MSAIIRGVCWSLGLMLLTGSIATAQSKPAQSKPAQPKANENENASTPKGEVLKFTFSQSKIFPATTRDYWVYIPAQYKPEKPACLWVCQDGIKYEAPTVFDRLIASGEMPITIGLFVQPGRVVAENEEQALDRFNRSYEYDGLGDNYARFLIEELLPDVETKRAGDGRAIRISQNPNDRSIGGSSSGGIAAFNVAWERPDSFRRVFTTVGTYVGLRGGDELHTLVRKYEPKPLRIYLQDGSNDLNIYAGDWWMANQTMERSLTFAGYEVNHAWGDGGHDAKHGTAIFADAMKWLWKGYPEPITAGHSKNGMLNEIVDTDSDWQLVGEGYRSTEGPTANAQGELFFNDGPNNKTYRVTFTNGNPGEPQVFLENSNRGDGQEFGPDGRLYAVAAATEQILAYNVKSPKESPQVIADGFKGNDLVVAHNGNLFITEPGWDGKSPSKIWCVRPDGGKSVVDRGLKFSNGITLSPDQTLLYVADSRTKWVYSYRVAADGKLSAKQRYFWLHEPDALDDSGADGLCVDRDGRVYVATRMGIQVCDQPGRVNCILPTPNERVSNVCFAGENFDILVATCGDKVYCRKLKIRGMLGWQAPAKPEKPRL